MGSRENSDRRARYARPSDWGADETLHLVTSIKRGTVTASPMLRKLSSYPRRKRAGRGAVGDRADRTHPLTLDWLQDVELRRRVHAGLNKSEAKNASARAVSFSRPGEVRGRSFEHRRPSRERTQPRRGAQRPMEHRLPPPLGPGVEGRRPDHRRGPPAASSRRWDGSTSTEPATTAAATTSEREPALSGRCDEPLTAASLRPVARDIIRNSLGPR